MPTDRYDPVLIGEMVRWWRKLGNHTPEGQPLTSQEGEEMARLANDAVRLREALEALGVIGGGYCFCAVDRDPDKLEHEPECRDCRAALRPAEQGKK